MDVCIFDSFSSFVPGTFFFPIVEDNTKTSTVQAPASVLCQCLAMNLLHLTVEHWHRTEAEATDRGSLRLWSQFIRIQPHVASVQLYGYQRAS